MDSGIALRRFGLCGGARDAGRLGSDPLGALVAELRGAAREPALGGPELLTTQAASEVFAARRERGRAVQAGTAERDPAAFLRIATGPVRQQELERLVGNAVATPRPLEERLALFWANHFTVSTARAAMASMVGTYEREALRPRMLGRFEALLKAASFHPAMLRYLDNHASVGRNSARGRGRGAVNENLAREILELHTLGVDGGYAQADVTAFAAALSGWTAGVWMADSGESLGTVFDAARHEPGPKEILGRTYAQDGPDQAPAVLRDIARHPSTIRHVTRGLATHFLGDAPPPAVLADLAETWRRTDGDLLAVTEALLRRPESASLPRVKLRPPVEFAMAACRVLGHAVPPGPLLRDLGAMGQPVFSANSPKGWPEENDAWVAPDGIKTRLDWSQNVAARMQGLGDPRALAEQAFGSDLSDATRRAIAGAESPKQGIALLLMSPEMQRR